MRQNWTSSPFSTATLARFLSPAISALKASRRRASVVDSNMTVGFFCTNSNARSKSRYGTDRNASAAGLATGSSSSSAEEEGVGSEGAEEEEDEDWHVQIQTS